MEKREIKRYIFIAFLAVAVCVISQNFAVFVSFLSVVLGALKPLIMGLMIAYIFNIPLPFAVYAHFVFMQGIAAVAAPGVMGGVLMASVGLLESIMGFGPEQTALVMTLYLALDGYGPACNVTGDGAIALVIDSIFKKKDNE